MDFRSIGNYHIEWIVAFVAVAQYGGFSAAAKELYRSQLRVGNHVDLAVRLVMPLLSDNRLASRVLWREPLVAVVAGAHRLAGAPYLRLRQGARFPLIAIGESTDGVGRQFEANLAFTQAGLTPAIAFQTNQPQTLVSMVRRAIGVGVPPVQTDPDGVPLHLVEPR